MIRFAAILMTSVLAGCQTNEQHQARVNADLDARLLSYNGATIAEFIARTGMVPSSAYAAGDGRVFAFQTAPVFVTLPATNVTPAVTRSSQCQLLVKATPNGHGATPGDWTITDVKRSGACMHAPI
ncbi:hypothetical protein [Rhizobium sp.]|uniref:hypothetical protein n=1 Tax=Rhizobium sp. TaxID=391 RepID=UPI0028AC46ED